MRGTNSRRGGYGGQCSRWEILAAGATSFCRSFCRRHINATSFFLHLFVIKLSTFLPVTLSITISYCTSAMVNCCWISVRFLISLASSWRTFTFNIRSPSWNPNRIFVKWSVGVFFVVVCDWLRAAYIKISFRNRLLRPFFTRFFNLICLCSSRMYDVGKPMWSLADAGPRKAILQWYFNLNT